MKQLVTLLSFLVISLSADGQILYRITGNGLDKPSYLMGTHHLCPGSFCDSLPGFNQAFEQVERICCEIDMIHQSPAQAQALYQHMILPEGQTLASLYTEEQRQQLDQWLKPYFGGGTEILVNLKPVTVMINVQNQILTKAMPKITTEPGIDVYLQQLAVDRNKEIAALETMEFQMEMLYNEPLEEQAEALLAIFQNEDLETISLELTDAYRSQDIRAIKRLIRKESGGKESYNKMIKSRNLNWMEQIPQLISQQPTLIAVGAGHLPGRYGLIRQLKKAGYTVEAVR